MLFCYWRHVIGRLHFFSTDTFLCVTRVAHMTTPNVSHIIPIYYIDPFWMFHVCMCLMNSGLGTYLWLCVVLLSKWACVPVEKFKKNISVLSLSLSPLSVWSLYWWCYLVACCVLVVASLVHWFRCGTTLVHRKEKNKTEKYPCGVVIIFTDRSLFDLCKELYLLNKSCLVLFFSKVF